MERELACAPCRVITALEVIMKSLFLKGAAIVFAAALASGAAQAAEDINKAGGILGQKIEVEQGDDVSDPKQGVSVANKFVGDGVKFVVDHFNSGVTMPASDVYSDNGI